MAMHSPVQALVLVAVLLNTLAPTDANVEGNAIFSSLGFMYICVCMYCGGEILIRVLGV